MDWLWEDSELASTGAMRFPLGFVKTKTFLFWIFLMLFAAIAIGVAFRLDGPLREGILATQGRSPEGIKWKDSAEAHYHATVRDYGDWPELMFAGAAGLLVAWRLRSRRWIHIIAAAMLASTLAGIIANTSRATTGRTRPRESPKIAYGFYGPYHEGKWLIGQPAYNSFPSGHTATAFGFAGVIFLAAPAAGVVALLIAAQIAWSSIVIGAHHPSDIMVSAILALLVAWFTWKWVQTRGDAVWAKLIKRIRREKSS